MRKAIIYSPTKNLMQTGNCNLGKWKLVLRKEYENKQEHLMGWVAAFETQNQVILYFNSKEEAVGYANNNLLTYDICENVSSIKQEPKNAVFNFAKNRNLYYF